MYSGSGYYGGASYDGYGGRGYSRDHGGQNDEGSTIGKLKEEYWLTKQKFIKKFNRKEDSHVVAGDADLDAKLEVFRSIEKTTLDLLKILEKYQDRICNLSGEENAMGRFLKNHSQTDKSRAGKMMAAVGKVQSYSAQQRLAIRAPLQRLYQEVDTFRHRAIADSSITLQRMEKARTEYRAALLWMKDISENLDPDTHKQLEKFRTVQGQVRRTKTRFDKLKVDCIQKIDLLAASRCNMFSNVLTSYQTCIISFLEKNSRALNAVSQTFYGYQPYEFSVIKELADPAKKLQQLEDKEGEKDEIEPESSSYGQNLDEVDRLIKEIKEIGRGCRSNFRVGPKLFDDEAEKDDAQDSERLRIDTPTLSGLISLDNGSKRIEDAGDRDGDLKSSDSLVNLFADLGQDGPSAADLAALEAHGTHDSSNNELQMLSSDIGSDGDTLLSEDLDNLTLLNEIMGTGPPNAVDPSQLDPSADLQGLHMPTYPMGQHFDAQGMPGSAFYSFNQQWNAHFGFASTSGMEPMQSWQQPPVQQQMTQPPTAPASGPFPDMQAPPSYNDAMSSLNSDSNFASESGNIQKGAKKDLSAWYGMFAELDPLANPDAIGKDGKDENDRNC